MAPTFYEGRPLNRNTTWFNQEKSSVAECMQGHLYYLKNSSSHNQHDSISPHRKRRIHTPKRLRELPRPSYLNPDFSDRSSSTKFISPRYMEPPSHMALASVPSPMNINRDVKLTSKYLQPPVYHTKNNGLIPEGTQSLLEYMRNKRHQPERSISEVLKNIPGGQPPILHHIKNYHPAPVTKTKMVSRPENKEPHILPKVVQVSQCPVVYCYPTVSQPIGQIVDQPQDLRQIYAKTPARDSRVVYEIVIPPNPLNQAISIPVNICRQM